MTGQTVWLASYPKSGNTWVRAVWTALRSGDVPDINALEGGPVASLRAGFDGALGLASSDLTDDEIDQLRPRADEVIGFHDTDLHLRKVHDAFFPGPAGEPVVSVAVSRSVLYVMRDPRDVAVSFAHHMDRPPSWAVAYMADPWAMLDGNVNRLSSHLRARLGSWSGHLDSWLGQTVLPTHVVRYEDALADPVATFSTLVQAAGLRPIDNCAVAQAVEDAGFDRLRDQERRSGFKERAATTSAFFRNGRAGGWREELSPSLARRIEADHGEMMTRFGYTDR